MLNQLSASLKHNIFSFHFHTNMQLKNFNKDNHHFYINHLFTRIYKGIEAESALKEIMNTIQYTLLQNINSHENDSILVKYKIFRDNLTSLIEAVDKNEVLSQLINEKILDELQTLLYGFKLRLNEINHEELKFLEARAKYMPLDITSVVILASHLVYMPNYRDYVISQFSILDFDYDTKINKFELIKLRFKILVKICTENEIVDLCSMLMSHYQNSGELTLEFLAALSGIIKKEVVFTRIPYRHILTQAVSFKPSNVNQFDAEQVIAGLFDGVNYFDPEAAKEIFLLPLIQNLHEFARNYHWLQNSNKTVLTFTVGILMQISKYYTFDLETSENLTDIIVNIFQLKRLMNNIEVGLTTSYLIRLLDNIGQYNDNVKNKYIELQQNTFAPILTHGELTISDFRNLQVVGNPINGSRMSDIVHHAINVFSAETTIEDWENTIDIMCGTLLNTQLTIDYNLQKQLANAIYNQLVKCSSLVNTVNFHAPLMHNANHDEIWTVYEPVGYILEKINHLLYCLGGLIRSPLLSDFWTKEHLNFLLDLPQLYIGKIYINFPIAWFSKKFPEFFDREMIDKIEDHQSPDAGYNMLYAHLTLLLLDKEIEFFKEFEPRNNIDEYIIHREILNYLPENLGRWCYNNNPTDTTNELNETAIQLIFKTLNRLSSIMKVTNIKHYVNEIQSFSFYFIMYLIAALKVSEHNVQLFDHNDKEAIKNALYHSDNLVFLHYILGSLKISNLLDVNELFNISLNLIVNPGRLLRQQRWDDDPAIIDSYRYRLLDMLLELFPEFNLVNYIANDHAYSEVFNLITHSEIEDNKIREARLSLLMRLYIKYKDDETINARLADSIVRNWTPNDSNIVLYKQLISIDSELAQRLIQYQVDGFFTDYLTNPDNYFPTESSNNARHFFFHPVEVQSFRGLEENEEKNNEEHYEPRDRTESAESAYCCVTS